MYPDLKRLIKIQQKMLDGISRKSRVVIWGELNDNTMFISFDDHSLHFIPKKHYYLDLSNDFSPVQFSKITNMFSQMDNFSLTKEVHRIKRGDRTLVRIETEEGLFAYYDESLMKYFPKDSQLWIIGETTPIYVKEGEEVLGFMLPIKVNQHGN